VCVCNPRHSTSSGADAVVTQRSQVIVVFQMSQVTVTGIRLQLRKIQKRENNKQAISILLSPIQITPILSWF
jgi:hypothetical protein